jgi:predicted nuclease of restriction endonuclease-like (RecB) superfamily
VLTELSWSHYLLLIRIEDDQKRKFYEQECIKSCWSVRQLERQVNSSLYERLSLSRDKEGVLLLSKEGAEPFKPNHIIKDPLILEFIDVKRKTEVFLADSSLYYHTFRHQSKMNVEEIPYRDFQATPPCKPPHS